MHNNVAIIMHINVIVFTFLLFSSLSYEYLDFLNDFLTFLWLSSFSYGFLNLYMIFFIDNRHRLHNNVAIIMHIIVGFLVLGII